MMFQFLSRMSNLQGSLISLKMISTSGIWNPSSSMLSWTVQEADDQQVECVLSFSMAIIQKLTIPLSCLSNTKSAPLVKPIVSISSWGASISLIPSLPYSATLTLTGLPSASVANALQSYGLAVNSSFVNQVDFENQKNEGFLMLGSNSNWAQNIWSEQLETTLMGVPWQAQM